MNMISCRWSSIESSCCRKQEEPIDCILQSEITDDDVILGRGRGIMKHVGNKKFMSFVRLNQNKYQSTQNKKDKTLFANDLVQVLRQIGCRFVNFNPKIGAYHEVGNAIARDKVANLLRKTPVNFQAVKRKTKKPPRRFNQEHFEKLLAKQRQIFKELNSAFDNDNIELHKTMTDDVVDITTMMDEHDDIMHQGVTAL